MYAFSHSRNHSYKLLLIHSFVYCHWFHFWSSVKERRKVTMEQNSNEVRYTLNGNWHSVLPCVNIATGEVNNWRNMRPNNNLRVKNRRQIRFSLWICICKIYINAIAILEFYLQWCTQTHVCFPFLTQVFSLRRKTIWRKLLPTHDVGTFEWRKKYRNFDYILRTRNTVQHDTIWNKNIHFWL